MEDKDREFLASFAEKLEKTLVDQCTADELLDGKILEVEELDEKWRTSAPEYMVAAVPQIAQYPSAAIAWACYVGMGAAVLWDKSWGEYKDTENWYELMASPRGFDEMDEYVVECLVGYPLGGEQAKKLEEVIRSLANTAHTMIRKENIPPQSVMAFHVFARTVKVFYELGITIELRHRGYNYVKVQVNGSTPLS